MPLKNKDITIATVSEHVVTAHPPISPIPQRETLSEVDEWLTRSSHWLGFSLRFDSILDMERIKRGLELTLAHFPALGARVDTSSNRLYEFVLSEEHQGVLLEYCKGTCSTDTLPNDSHVRDAWKSAGVDAPGPGFSGEATLKDPLLRAKLVVFDKQKVSYLCIGINHGVCDGSGMCDVLQVWSHFCFHDSVDGLSRELNRPRAFGQRVTTPMKPARDEKELYERLESDVGCTQNPLSLTTLLFSIAPKAIWCMNRQHEVELRVSAKRLLNLKETVSAKLPLGKWASRFEVLCATVLLAQAATSNRKRPCSHNLHVACNLRGRTARFPTEYFGNAAFDFHQPLENIPTEYNIDTLVIMTQSIHNAVRRGLDDPEEICKTKDWFEAARHLGLKNTHDVWAPVVMDALSGNGTFVNSWDKRWLDVKMGSDNRATMAAFFGILPNLIIEVPRDYRSGDSTIYLALPHSHAMSFCTFCQENKDMVPFDVVVALGS
jgi:hypothetical protein